MPYSRSCHLCAEPAVFMWGAAYRRVLYCCRLHVPVFLIPGSHDVAPLPEGFWMNAMLPPAAVVPHTTGHLAIRGAEASMVIYDELARFDLPSPASQVRSALNYIRRRYGLPRPRDSGEVPL